MTDVLPKENAADVTHSERRIAAGRNRSWCGESGCLSGLGCNGGTSYATPNLDRLAAAGTRFTHGYVNPIWTPTRVPLMTGL